MAGRDTAMTRWGTAMSRRDATLAGGRIGRGATSASAHSQMENGCITCHMAPASEGTDPTLVGGHTFRVKTKGDLPPAFNAAQGGRRS